MYIFQRKEKTEEVQLKQTDLEIQAGVISPNLNFDHSEISFRKNAFALCYQRDNTKKIVRAFVSSQPSLSKDLYKYTAKK